MKGDWRETFAAMEACNRNLESQLQAMDTLTNRAELAMEILAEWYVEDLPQRIRKTTKEDIIRQAYDEAVRRDTKEVR